MPTVFADFLLTSFFSMTTASFAGAVGAFLGAGFLGGGPKLRRLTLGSLRMCVSLTARARLAGAYLRKLVNSSSRLQRRFGKE